MRISLLFGAVSLACSSASAQSINDKLCILAAAQKVPQIQGAIVVAGTAKTVPADEIVSQLVSSFVTNAAAAEALGPIFGFIDASLNEKLRYEYTAGGPEVVRDAIIKAIRPNVNSGATVEVTVRAVGMDSVYEFSCATGTLGVYAAPRGLIR